MEAVEALLAVVEQFNKRRNEARTAAVAEVPASAPVVSAAPPRARPAAPSSSPDPVRPVAAKLEPLIPFASGGSRSIVRAMIASEVLRPPLALREED